MKCSHFHALFAAIAIGLVCCSTFAQKAPNQSPGLCEAHEESVFSCTLQGPGRKSVSLCASAKSAQGERSFRYLYGRPSKIELEYPKGGSSNADAFSRTHLLFAGNTGGYAYAFTNGGFKYILYAISGTGFERSGVLVQREGQMRANRDMHCKDSTLVEASHELWDAASKWKVDADIDAHGLPSID